MLKPIRNNVKLEITSNKKTKSGILIKSEEGTFHEAHITAYGAEAKTFIPELEIGKRVELLSGVSLKMFNEDDGEFAIIDAGTIIGIYE